jgi:hypothetical protein
MLSKIVCDGCLEVTDEGSVFRIKSGKKVAAALTPCSRNCKYRAVTYYAGGHQHRIYVHRLVAEAFI